MSVPLDCPGIDCWQALLEVELPPEQIERFEHHLQECPACQSWLDRVEDAEVGLRRRARSVGDPTVAPVDPTLARFLEHMHEEKARISAVAGEPAEMSFLRPGDRPDILGTLGGCEVQEVIGQGGMGIVLKAFEPALNRMVAIKVMAPFLASSANARRRFTREAQAAAAVSHDHVVAVHRVSEASGLPFLVMQYIAGESLQNRLDREGPLKAKEIVRIGLQTAKGLAAAHAQGLIHRDVKPANLLLMCRHDLDGTDGTDGSHQSHQSRPSHRIVVKITDFGLARMVDDVGLTQHGVVAGTPEYMAPEQARGEAPDHRSDLFSLGSVLYACCTGGPPFRGSSAVGVLRMVSDEEPAPVREQHPRVTNWLAELVTRLMKKNPADRFQSAAEVAALLEGYLTHLEQPNTVSAPELSPVVRVAHQRPLRIWFVALAALALLAGGVLWFQGGAGPKNSPPEQNEKARPPQAEGDQRKQDRLTFDFRVGVEKFPALSLFGPDVETMIKTDPQGLRFTLPAGRADPGIIGVRLTRRLRGDFDITVGFEILAIGAPLPQYGSGVVLRVWYDVASDLSSVVARMRRPYGEIFAAHRVIRERDDGEEKYLNTKEWPATQRAGKLQLVRTGSQVRHLVSEGEQFREIQTLSMGSADVRDLHVFLTTIQAPILMDVRLTALDIRADSIEKDAVGTTGVQASDSPIAMPRPSLLAIGILGVGLTVIAAFGAWLVLRCQSGNGAGEAGKERVKGVTAVRIIPFDCSHCNKRLKARDELVGKRIKCPQCGEVVVVPR
jgi:serine/threonine protein kinase